MMSLFVRYAVAAILLTVLVEVPGPVQAAARDALSRSHVAAKHFTHARTRVARPRRRGTYVSVPRIPRYDPAQVEAEVHEVARYRTPYPYPALFGPY